MRFGYFTWTIKTSPYNVPLNIDFFSIFGTKQFKENKLKQRIYEKALKNPKDYFFLTKIRSYSKKGGVREAKKRPRHLNFRKKIITKTLKVAGETYAFKKILGNEPQQTLAFQHPTHYHSMFILWWSYSLTKQINKQTKISYKTSPSSMQLKSPPSVWNSKASCLPNFSEMR